MSAKRPAFPVSASAFPGSRECAAQHDMTNAAGAGILVLDATTQFVLLGLRGMDCASPHCWAPFGGMVDPGETPVRAAKRELYEEAGIASHQYVMLDNKPFHVNHDAATGFRFYTFAAVVTNPLRPVLNDESLGFGWFSLRDLPKHAQMHPGFCELLETRQERLQSFIDLLPAYNMRPR